MSLSIDYGESDYLKSACYWGSEESLLVVSAGNNKDEIKEYYIPASYDSTLTVGAVNRKLDRCDYGDEWGSNYGEYLDIMGPGKDIFSTQLGNIYGYSEGRTSAAAAYVSGVAALVFASPIDKDFDENENDRWDANEVRKKLLDTAIYLGDEYYYGHGLVNAGEAVKAKAKALSFVDNNFEKKVRDKYD